MRIGYARVSKANGSQSLDPQRDALRAGGGRRRQRSAPLVPSTVMEPQAELQQLMARQAALKQALQEVQRRQRTLLHAR